MTDSTKIRVLLIDDDEDEYVIVQDLFAEINAGFSLDWVDNFDDGLSHILHRNYDIYLIDYRLGPRTGLDLIREVKQREMITPMILLTGQGDREIDLEAMTLGAADYLVKTEVNPNSLARSIRYALTSSRNLLELRTKEQKYRSLFERSVDPIYIVDADLLVTDVNKSFMSLLGFCGEDLADSPLKNIFEDPDEYEAYESLLREHGQVRDIEVNLMSKDERIKECTINGVALQDNDGIIYGFQGIIHDLSLRKQAEQDLLVAEKLAMTGNIARSIAHEVRNPLTNLNLALEQLDDDLGELPDGDYGMYLDIIHRNANRIDQLITEMLKSSKPKEPDLRPYNLNQLLEEVIDMTNDRIKLRGIELVTSKDESLPVMKLDPEQMRTAILNIVINAIESMEDDEEGRLEMGTLKKDQQLLLYVQDTGKGIERDQLRKLFDPFFTGKRGGMGLGLTSSQNIINSHKGKVDVKSEVGKGTRFEVCFPIRISENNGNPGN